MAIAVPAPLIPFPSVILTHNRSLAAEEHMSAVVEDSVPDRDGSVEVVPAVAYLRTVRSESVVAAK